MPFISYAQNREDVLLRRALADVSEGFYVDVGAQDPDVYSVTKAFYETGWKGINIEPVEFWYEKLIEARPNDLNIRSAAGTGDGEIDFYEIEDTGLSTIDEKQAETHRKAGFKVKKTTAPVKRLDAILAEQGVTKIHFLKIDVEGAEEDVLRSVDLHKWRPWVVVVEATIPMSEELADPAWEALLIDASYDYVYFDGLNKYYVPRERAYLKRSFAAPPNVFDQYLTITEKKGKDDEAKLAANIEELNKAREHLGELVLTVEQLNTATEQLSVVRQQLGVAEERIAKLELVRNSLVADNQRLTLRVAEKRAENGLLHIEVDNLSGAIRQATAGFERVQADANRVQANANQLQAQVTSLAAEIEAVHRSTSWRVTTPIRSLRTGGRNLLMKSRVLRKIYMTLRPVGLGVFRVFFRR
jgi:FkbM family methyltransferase